MKLIIVLAALVAVALSAPADSDITIVNETPSDNFGVGNYKYGYELSNGATRQETAELIGEGTDDQYYRIEGTYSYPDPITGAVYTVKYTADKDGFRAEAPHIPA